MAGLLERVAVRDAAGSDADTASLQSLSIKETTTAVLPEETDLIFPRVEKLKSSMRMTTRNPKTLSLLRKKRKGCIGDGGF